MFNIAPMGSFQNMPGMSNMSGLGGISAGLNLNIGINLSDKANLSPNILDKFNPQSLLGNLGNLGSNMLSSLGAGIGCGQGMVPGFGGATNPMGSMFGGMQQQNQMMMQMMQMMMQMMMMQMMQMMQNGFGGQQAANGANGAAAGSNGVPASGGSSATPAASGSTPGAPTPISGEKKGTAKGTGYYPDSSAMEGGYVDKKGAKLCTLQDFLAGKAPYVSIALDNNLYKNGQVKYGDTFRIPELEQKYGKQIIFKAVDTGGAFTGKGFGRVDICTASKKDSMDSTVNGNLTLIKT